MLRSQILQSQIDVLEQKVAPLLQSLARLRFEQHEAKSREFIEVNQITREQIHSPDDGPVYFETIMEFIQWLNDQPPKPWAEWNGVIYRSDDLLNNRMPDMPGRVDHIPECPKT